MSNLPAGFEQIDLFQETTPEPEPKKKKRKKETVYRCKCGHTVGAPIPIVSVRCLCCGKQMTPEE